MLFLELRENQENLCKMPAENANFVGREKQLNECSQVLDHESKKTFLIITGGPCCGKSSLAVKLGYEMYDKGYSYVIWIDIRDIAKSPSNPSLEDIVAYILQKFDIDTSDIEKDIIRYLKVKMRMIAESDKSALLIFDNADCLIEPERDDSCSSSVFQDLCELIEAVEGNSIRCIFTSCKSKSLTKSGHYIVKLGSVSNADSQLFVTKRLQDLQFPCDANVINTFVNVGNGLPYALELMCSEAIVKGKEKRINQYVDSLKMTLQDTSSEEENSDSILNKLFKLSYERLDEEERSLFKLMTYIPFAISSKYLFKVLSTFAIISNPSNLLDQLNRRCLVSFDSGRYMIHPFLRDFVTKEYWNEDSRKTHEEAYYKAYINQLFELARKSLEKDYFVECLEEFRNEQQNFLHVMKEVGKGSANTQLHIRDVLSERLTRKTPEYISVVLFLCHEVYDKYAVALIDFFAGCETFVEGSMKKSIWCCRFDVNMAISEEEIDDDYEELEADEFGKLLVEKRKCYQTAFRKQHAEKNFDAFMKRVENLEDCEKNVTNVKRYFEASFLKIKVRLLNKFSRSRTLENKKTEVFINDLRGALKICESTFGVHWLTIDCHIQFGKLYWGVSSRDNAKASFEAAIDLAQPIFKSRKYLSCLVEKGRLLLLSDSQELVEEGRSLIDQALKGCKDFFDETMRLSAMATYVKVDKVKREEMTNIFLKKQWVNNRWLQIMRSVVDTELDFPSKGLKKEDFISHEKRKVEQLQQITKHLEYICDDMRHEEEKLLQNLRPDMLIYGYSESELSKATSKSKQQLQIRISELFIFNMKIATTCMHVLSEHDTKEVARKALHIMDSNDFITAEKREELLFIVRCDRSRYLRMKEKCYIEQMGKRIPAMKDKLQKYLLRLLEEYEKYQGIWSWAIQGLAREDKSLYEKVIPYLCRQSEPHELLLNLVLYKFYYHTGVYDRESDDSVIEKESKHAVDEMKKAVAYVEGLLKNNVRKQSNTSRALEDTLKRWYKGLALHTKRVLNKAERGKYAKKALGWLEEGDDIITAKEKEILETLASKAEKRDPFCEHKQGHAY